MQILFIQNQYKWVVKRHIEKKHNVLSGDNEMVFSYGNFELMTTSEGEMKVHKLKVHDIIYKGYAEVEGEDFGVIKKRSWNHPNFKERGCAYI